VNTAGLRFTEAPRRDLLAASGWGYAPMSSLVRVLQLLDGSAGDRRRALAASASLASTSRTRRTARPCPAGLSPPQSSRACRPRRGPRRRDGGREGEGVAPTPSACELRWHRSCSAPTPMERLGWSISRRWWCRGEGQPAVRRGADFALEPPRSTSDLAGPPRSTRTADHLDGALGQGSRMDVVHILHATTDDPSDMSLSTPSGLEEERRCSTWVDPGAQIPLGLPTARYTTARTGATTPTAGRSRRVFLTRRCGPLRRCPRELRHPGSGRCWGGR